MDLLSEDNYCGQSLMRLVSRGSAIITELLRLSEYIPSAFLDDPPTEAQVYAPIISDFACLKDLDTYENSITDNQEHQELDETFREANLKILERFYMLFESVYKYHSDYLAFLKELTQGTFIHYNPENMLQHPEGKKLMVEALYLLGVMLLLMDMKIPGTVRERLLVSYYRYKGHSTIMNIDDVCSLCRVTGYLVGESVIPSKRPPNYPEEYFMRCPVPLDIVEIMIGHLKDDDFYSQVTVFPSPEHRPTALSGQAAILFIVLYFFPTYLENQNNRMREIVDKFFPDNWVIAFYLGFTVDLAEQWSPYKAAKAALIGYTLIPENIQKVYTKYMGSIRTLNKALNHYLKEGVLVEEYILSHRSKLMNNLRDCNVTLRWIMLAKLSGVKKIYDQINTDLNLSRVPAAADEHRPVRAKPQDQARSDVGQARGSLGRGQGPGGRAHERTRGLLLRQQAPHARRAEKRELRAVVPRNGEPDQLLELRGRRLRLTQGTATAAGTGRCGAELSD